MVIPIDEFDEKIKEIEIKTVGQAIKVGRLKKGWTQKKLGKEVGLHPDTISLLEQDKVTIHVIKIILLENTLNTPIAIYDEYYRFASISSEQFSVILNRFKMSKQQLAVYLEVDKTTIDRWATGKTFISRTYFDKLMQLK